MPNADEPLTRESAGRALGDLLGGGKGRALTAEERGHLRALAHRCGLLTVPAADVLALLDATEPVDAP